MRLLKFLAVMTFFGVFCWAENHHQELNGTWSLIPARSQFNGGPVLRTGTVTILDRQHNIYVSENFTYDQGDRTITYSFRADAPRNASIHVEPNLKSKARWRGDALEVTSTHDNLTTVERYNLAQDGSLVLTVDGTGHGPETLVFERQ
jgi:hypothetical protein